MKRKIERKHKYHLYFTLGDTRSTLNGLICWAMLDIIGNVFQFPFRFFTKAQLQLPSIKRQYWQFDVSESDSELQCFVVQVHLALQKVIETHTFLTKTNVYSKSYLHISDSKIGFFKPNNQLY